MVVRLQALEKCNRWGLGKPHLGTPKECLEPKPQVPPVDWVVRRVSVDVGVHLEILQVRVVRKGERLPNRTLGALTIGNENVNIPGPIGKCVADRHQNTRSERSRRDENTILEITVRVDTVFLNKLVSITPLILLKDDVECNSRMSRT